MTHGKKVNCLTENYNNFKNKAKLKTRFAKRIPESVWRREMLRTLIYSQF